MHKLTYFLIISFVLLCWQCQTDSSSDPSTGTVVQSTNNTATNASKNYKIDLPEATQISHTRYVKTVIPIGFLIKNNQPTIIIDNSFKPLHALENYLIKEVRKVDPQDRERIVCALEIDRMMPYKYVKLLKEELKRLMMNNVMYITKEDRSKQDVRLGVVTKLSPYIEELHFFHSQANGVPFKKVNPVKYIDQNVSAPPAVKFLPIHPDSKEIKGTPVLFIDLFQDQQIRIDGQLTDYKSLKKQLTDEILKNEKSFILRLAVHDEVFFKDYLRLFDFIKSVYKELDKEMEMRIADYGMMELSYISYLKSNDLGGGLQRFKTKR